MTTPTAAESRAANALLREVMMDSGTPPITNPFDLIRGPNRDKVLRQVRAVIRSLFEPDETMLAAYMAALEQPANPDKEPWHKAKMRKRWRAMIDAASPP